MDFLDVLCHSMWVAIILIVAALYFSGAALCGTTWTVTTNVGVDGKRMSPSTLASLQMRMGSANSGQNCIRKALMERGNFCWYDFYTTQLFGDNFSSIDFFMPSSIAQDVVLDQMAHFWLF